MIVILKNKLEYEVISLSFYDNKVTMLIKRTNETLTILSNNIKEITE